MKSLEINLIALFFCVFIYAQDSKEFDLIVLIDDKIETLAGFTIQLEGLNDTLFLSPSYHPGSLVFNKSQLDKLYSDKYTKRTMIFENGIGRKNYLYKIGFITKYLEQRYVILKIYNLNKWKYRRKYAPADEDSNFSVIWDLGYYQIIKLKK